MTARLRRAARERLRPDLRASLPAYEPIEPPEVLAAHLGLDPARILKLDGNENPYGPSDLAIEAIREAALNYAIYPDPQQCELRSALSGHLGVPADQIVAGAGSDELIDLLLRLFVAPDDAVVICPPTFGMYRFSTLVQGGRVIEVPRDAQFAIDAEAAARAIESNDAKLVFLASPNNPTGNLISAPQLDRLLATDALVVIDEAYVEFAGTGGFVGRVAKGAPNLAVLRTFSKWAGLAGLRVGYGVFPPDVAELLMTVKPPYTPNSAATLAALASLEDSTALIERVNSIARDRVRLASGLERVPGLQPFPSQANFLLVRIEGRDALAVRDELRKRGIFVRYFDTPPIDDCLRITAGTPEQNDVVIAALHEVMS